MEEYTLIEKLRRVEALTHRLRTRGRHREDGWRAGPHRGQGRVLALLQMQPDISQKQLCFLLDMRPQSLGELLAKLEKAGLITREPSQTDRRVMNIHLTEAGVQAAEEATKPRTLDMFGPLTDDEQETLATLLDKLIEGLETRLAESGDDAGDGPCPPHDPRMCGGPREGWGPCPPHGPHGPRGRGRWDGPRPNRGWHGEGFERPEGPPPQDGEPEA